MSRYLLLLALVFCFAFSYLALEYLLIGSSPRNLPSRIEQLAYHGRDRAANQYLSDPTGYYLWRYGSFALIILIAMLLGYRFRKFLPFALGAVLGGIGGAVGGLLLTLFFYLFGHFLGYLAMIFTPFLPFEDSGIFCGSALGLWIAFIYSLRQWSVMQRKQKALKTKNANREG